MDAEHERSLVLVSKVSSCLKPYEDIRRTGVEYLYFGVRSTYLAPYELSDSQCDVLLLAAMPYGAPVFTTMSCI